MSARRDFDLPALRAGVLAGEKRAVARAITLVENRDALAYELVREIYPHTGGAMVAGFTGPPGVGKSSLLSSLVTLLRSDQKTVGMVSVDPSSPFSHGAVLGDRIRLSDHFLDPGVFIRSMSTRGHLGGDLRGHAAGAAGAGRLRQGCAAAGDGRRRPERGRRCHQSPTPSCWC